jgi:hypothetical protein
MNVVRRTFLIAAGAALMMALSATVALAQAQLEPNPEFEKNTGGWVYALAIMIAFAALGLILFLTVMYMRYAPRFARDQDPKVVHADRVLPGKEPPRRAVDMSQAVPIVVQPPALPSAVPAIASSAAASAAAPVVVAEAPAAPPAAPAQAEAAPASAAASAPAAPATPAAPAERQEVTMDQATFDATLEELLAKGTDSRVAEGQARRAGMIAARKKAAGEG